MKEKIRQKIKKLPQSPGVYIFKNSLDKILYIGKAKNIKKRVASHFSAKKSWPENFLDKINEIDYIECENEKQATLLEAELIKKYQPKYNIEWKDDKNYFFIGITKEDFPRIFITHQTIKNPNLAKQDAEYLGPFIKGKELKKFLAEVRKILPFRSCKNLPKKPCLYYSLKLCPAPCIHKRQKKKYQKIVESLKTIFEIYSGKSLRIEGYDISNISGTLATGSMVVFENSKEKKSEYRKFKIKKVKGQNDVGSLREVLLRRIKHKDWKKPNLIILDGGKGQLKAAKNIEIPVLALAKIKKHSGKLYSPFSKNSALLDKLPQDLKNLFLQVRDEAHRFAISYHKLRRKKKLIKE